ncbi:MAG: hypothetical protein LDL38_04250 [Flavobacterium piscis]|nr:hypothetical protein [Flavobacterium piscis]
MTKLVICRTVPSLVLYLKMLSFCSKNNMSAVAPNSRLETGVLC